jgi:hypothetical protein
VSKGDLTAKDAGVLGHPTFEDAPHFIPLLSGNLLGEETANICEIRDNLEDTDE